MSLRRRAVKGVVWSAAQSWGVRAISLITMLVLARLVLPEAFGLVAYASVFIAFAQIFIDQGFSDAIVQCSNLEREHLDSAFWANIVGGALIAAVGVVASGAIARLFREPQLEPIIGWLSISFILGGLSSVQAALLRRQLAFKSLALRSLVATITGGVVAIGIAFLGYGIWSLVTKILVSNAVGVVVLWKASEWRPGFRFSKGHFKELFSFGINIVGGNFVDFFSLRSDDFLIGYFLGSIALGYYSLAYNLLIVMTELLVSVPNAVLFPAFSRLQSGIDKMQMPFYEVTQLQSIVAFPVFLGMSVIAPELVLVFFGQRWMQSIPVVRILMLIGVVRSATYLYSSVIKAAGKPSWRLGVWSLTALLNVICFLLVVRRGIVAVAGAYVFVGYLVLPIYLLIIRKLIRISIRAHLEQYIPALSSSVVMIAVLFALKFFFDAKLGIPFSLLIYIVAGALAYFLTLRSMRPLLYKQMLNLVYLVIPRLQSKRI